MFFKSTPVDPKDNDAHYMVGITKDCKYAQLKVGNSTYVTLTLTLNESRVRDLIRMLESTLPTIGTSIKEF
jgi:hypothetical protein